MPHASVRLVLVVLLTCAVARAQDFQRFNFNIGGGPSFPLSDTNDVSGVSGHFVAGGGLNLSRAAGFNVEYMYEGLNIDDRFAQELGVPDVSGHVNSVTGNLIFRIPTEGRLGAYIIGGGGWYRRTIEATADVLTPGTICEPSFIWWGVACVNGLVPTTFVLGSITENSGGYNIGGGVTFGHTAKFYTEVRYHHTFNDNIDTDILPLTFGIRW